MYKSIEVTLHPNAIRLLFRGWEWFTEVDSVPEVAEEKSGCLSMMNFLSFCQDVSLLMIRNSKGLTRKMGRNKKIEWVGATSHWSLHADIIQSWVEITNTDNTHPPNIFQSFHQISWNVGKYLMKSKNFNTSSNTTQWIS